MNTEPARAVIENATKGAMKALLSMERGANATTVLLMRWDVPWMSKAGRAEVLESVELALYAIKLASGAVASVREQLEDKTFWATSRELQVEVLAAMNATLTKAYACKLAMDALLEKAAVEAAIHETSKEKE